LILFRRLPAGVTLNAAPPRAFDPSAGRNPKRHPVQPGGHRVSLPDRLSLPEQYEESRLEGIFGVVGICEQPAAHPPHHRAVPLDQCLEGCLVNMVASRKPLEQLPIRQVANNAGFEQDTERTRKVKRMARHRSKPSF
jgi:hypothetical protein